MKASNKFKKIIAGTLAASVLTNSCTQYHQSKKDDLYEESNFSNEGLNAVTIDFDKEEIEYLNFLNKLSSDIIEYPFIAREFAKNPKSFINRYGYNKEIDLEEGYLKLILALGDEDINVAIKNKDFGKFLNLLKEKQLFDEFSKFKINISEEDKAKITSLLKLSGIDKQLFCTPLAVVCIAYIVVAVGSFAVAVATVGVSLNAIASITVYTEIAGVSSNNMENTFIDNNPVFKVWGLKGDYKDSYIASNIYVEKEAENIILGIEKAFPDIFKDFSKDVFKQLIKLNLLKGDSNKNNISELYNFLQMK